MSRPAIVIEDLSKSYQLGARSRRQSTFREAITGAIRSRLGRGRDSSNGRDGDIFWALRGVSLEVGQGEVVGLIGRNGSGKSTMLKIISRITEPTEGCVRVRGRLASLLEVGTGFHPELTGRENVYLNGSILGMTKAEIDRKFDEIVAFAEVERFLDTQVKYYSSGMYVRLAFAVAAHLETQILLVDEVLAVGDAAFQKKCLGRIGEVTREGRTVLFVSHYMPTVRNLCTRCVMLEKGVLKMDGAPDDVLIAYNRSTVASRSSEESLVGHSGRTPGSIPSMTKIRVRALTDTPDCIHMGDDVAVDVFFEVDEPLNDVTFGINFSDRMTIPIFGNNSLVVPPEPYSTPISKGWISCRVGKLPLMPGDYSIDLYLGSNGQNFDIIHESCRFEVHSADVFGNGKIPPAATGGIYWPITWEINPEESHDAGSEPDLVASDRA